MAAMKQAGTMQLWTVEGWDDLIRNIGVTIGVFLNSERKVPIILYLSKYPNRNTCIDVGVTVYFHFVRSKQSRLWVFEKAICYVIFCFYSSL